MFRYLSKETHEPENLDINWSKGLRIEDTEDTCHKAERTPVHTYALEEAVSNLIHTADTQAELSETHRHAVIYRWICAKHRSM